MTALIEGYSRTGGGMQLGSSAAVTFVGDPVVSHHGAGRQQHGKAAPFSPPRLMVPASLRGTSGAWTAGHIAGTSAPLALCGAA